MAHVGEELALRLVRTHSRLAVLLRQRALLLCDCRLFLRDLHLLLRKGLLLLQIFQQLLRIGHIRDQIDDGSRLSEFIQQKRKVDIQRPLPIQRSCLEGAALDLFLPDVLDRLVQALFQLQIRIEVVRADHVAVQAEQLLISLVAVGDPAHMVDEHHRQVQMLRYVHSDIFTGNIDHIQIVRDQVKEQSRRAPAKSLIGRGRYIAQHIVKGRPDHRKRKADDQDDPHGQAEALPHELCAGAVTEQRDDSHRAQKEQKAVGEIVGHAHLVNIIIAIVGRHNDQRAVVVSCIAQPRRQQWRRHAHDAVEQIFLVKGQEEQIHIDAEHMRSPGADRRVVDRMPLRTEKHHRQRTRPQKGGDGHTQKYPVLSALLILPPDPGSPY